MAAPSELGDVLTLGQHRDAVRHDLVDGDLGEARHGLRRLAGPDPGLYVARAKGAVHLDLQLAEPRTIAPEGRTKPVVCGRGELCSRVVDEDDLVAVRAQPHELELAHALPFPHCASLLPQSQA
jgi:hypothetical protein